MLDLEANFNQSRQGRKYSPFRWKKLILDNDKGSHSSAAEADKNVSNSPRVDTHGRA